MTTLSRRHFLYLIICLQILCYSLFLVGFFPLKKSVPGFATLQNYSLDQHEIVQPERQFDKVVVILIDALRTDFIYEKRRMPYVSHLLGQGFANGYTVRAHPPTVTLPRIKALTSGTIPGFVDVVLNFDSKTLTEDNIVTQAYRHGRKSLFFGDDTWIKLFPDQFARSDGTTSFFVSDYTEVDDNVTRHLDTELSSLDWDVMILHYLGLDHIGHTVGPHSPLVAPKLKEMDDIIQKIYEQISTKEKNFLMLVCGDHGMSDQGSHGGASDRETLVPAVFIRTTNNHSSKRRESQRSPLQIDIAPTLSVLMGTPIPANNLGQILLGALDSMNVDQILSCMYINSQQIFRLMMENVPDYEKESSYQLYEHAKSLHINYLNNKDQSTDDVFTVVRSYESAMEAMSAKISGSLTTYDLYAMLLAMLLLCLCIIALGIVTLAGPKQVNVELPLHIVAAFMLLVVFVHMTICTSQSYDSVTLCGRSFISVIFQFFILCGLLLCIGAIANNIQTLKHRLVWIPKAILKKLLLIGTLLHTLSFGSSSFVEEEHQTWNFMCMTFYFVAMVTHVRGHIQSSLTGEITLNSDYGMQHSVLTSETNRNGVLFKKNTKNDKFQQKFHHVNLNKCSLVQCIHKVPLKQMFGILSLMLLCRCMRTINQTGNKWMDTPDIGDWLTRPDNKNTLSYTVVLSFCLAIFARTGSSYLHNIIFIAGVIGCYGYRVATGVINNFIPINASIEQSSQGIFEAKLVYCLILLLTTSAVIKYWLFTQQTHYQLTVYKQILQLVESLHNSWILVMFLLLRTHNIILVAMVILQEMLLFKFVIKKMDLPSQYLALLCWWIGQASFFHQGNSNSISTVDVSAGYVGLQDYQPVYVCMLLFCSTYAGPIYWLISLVKFIIYQQQTKWLNEHEEHEKRSVIMSRAFVECIQFLTLERMITLLFYCVVVTSQRYHLFVWTVFSPKLLYEAMHTLIVSLFSCILLGAVT